MSHYFYHQAFDYLSNDGNFGFYIEQSDTRNSTNSAVTEDYVIEVHYLGDAVTTLQLDVTQIDHTSSLNDVFYVSKGMVGKNGNKAANFADIVISIPSEVTARIQEAHITVSHIIFEIFEEKFLNA